MKENGDIRFTVRLTPDDWDPHLRAWRCPAFDLPSAFIAEARDAEGQPVALSLLKVEKGPARISWNGPGQISQITVVAGLGEELSPVTEERFWRNFAIVVPIITALIGATAAWITKGSGNSPGATPTLRLRVDPNDVDTSGLPPAKITINNQQLMQPVDYKVTSDVMAIVDVSKAFDFAKQAYSAYTSQKSSIADTIKGLTPVFQQLSNLQNTVNGNICSGGSNGVPPQAHVAISNDVGATISALQNINSHLIGVSQISVALPK